MAEERIRVLQFSIAESAGGRTQFILNFWNSIDKTKFAFDFITFSEKLSFEQEIINTGAKIYYIRNYPESNLEEFSREFKDILKNGYDVIHIATSFWKNTIIEKLACEAGIKKIIIHAHSAGLEARTGNYKEALERHNKIKSTISTELATDFVACSQLAADWLYGGVIPEEKITVINNGIDTKRFCYDPEKREKLRNREGLEKKYIIGFVGRLEQVKNIDFIIELFKEIYQTNKKAFLLIVGDGTLRQKLENTMSKEFPTDAYCFVGKTKKPEEYLLQMDVLLLPSLFEGFPITLIEAQCTGLKCLVSNNVTDEAIVTDMVEKIPLDRKEIWIDRLKDTSHGYKRQEQGDSIKGHNLDMDSVARKMEAIYEEVKK